MNLLKAKEILTYSPVIALGLARFAIEQLRPPKPDNKKVAKAAITYYPDRSEE